MILEVMSYLRLLKSVSLVLGCCVTTIAAEYVIDTKSPIVIHDTGDGGNSYLNDNYFGYSLAFLNKSFESGGRGRPGNSPRGPEGSGGAFGTLFIGAPNETRSQQNSGVVWKCSFNEGAQYSCSIWAQVSEQDSSNVGLNRNEIACRNRDREQRTSYPEPETAQWIGAALSASRTTVHACAPRWKRNGFNCRNETAMPGACYSASSENNILLDTTLNRPRSYYYPINPKLSEYWLRFAEYGMSSHVTRDDDHIVGAPSARKWKGIFVEHINLPARTVIHNENGNLVEVEDHSLLGYSITSGQLNGRNFIAVGAPRGNGLRGMVTLTYSSVSTTPFAFYRGQQFENPSFKLFGSYFGFAVAAVDLDGDRSDELIVGAPMRTDFRSSASYSSGCVFIVYLSQQRSEHSRICAESASTSSTRDTVQVSSGARFGSAIVNLGDINFDGREDFAVGAPYDDGGVGTVFIFYGSSSREAPSVPAQVIRGRQLGIPNLRGFGSHLIGRKTDVDGNLTPDLVVGTFESRHVVILRIRPVAKPNIHSITFLNPGTDESNSRPILKLLPTQEKVRVRVCFNFQFSVPTQDQIKLDTWLKFEVRSNQRHCEFEDGQPAEQKQTLPLTRVYCLVRRVKINNETTTNTGGTTDSKPPTISVTVKLWYNDTKTEESQPVQHANIKLTPPLPPQLRRPVFREDQSYQQAFHTFNPFLPAPIPLVEATNSLDIAEDNCGDDGCDPKLRLTVKIFYGEGASLHSNSYNPQTFLTVGKVEFIDFVVETKNEGETAYKPTTELSIQVSRDLEVPPNSLELLLLPQRGGRDRDITLCTPPMISDGYKGFVMNCTGSRPLQEKQTMIHTYRLRNLRRLKVLKKDLSKIIFKVKAEPSRIPDEKVGEISLKPDVMVEVEEGVSTLGQTQVEQDTEFVDLEQIFIIKNTGFSTTAQYQVKVEILVPTHTKNGTQVIGIVDPSGSALWCSGSAFFVPPETITQETGNMTGIPAPGISRVTRDVSQNSIDKASTNSPDKLTTDDAPNNDDDIISLKGCFGHRNAEEDFTCSKIECKTDLPSSGLREVQIKMYLFRKVLDHITDKKDTKGVKVESVISVALPTFDLLLREAGTAERKYFGGPTTQEKSIPAYVFLLSGGGGAILFLLIVYILFKCGFFRRKAKEQLQQLKRQTQMIDMNVLMAATPDGELQQIQDLHEEEDDDK